MLRRLGAEVDVLHAEPDGRNINDGCGSTAPERALPRSWRTGRDVGLAFDGDADRVLAVDDAGDLVDGDHLIAMCALDLPSAGRLADDTVVVTVMTNLGLPPGHGRARHRGGRDPGGRPLRARGARRATGCALGGEQSGHVIFRRLATTGDGLLTGVAAARPRCVRAGRWPSWPPRP